MTDALIIDACRTPRGIGKQGKGGLAHLHPQHVGATVLKALADRNSLDTSEVDDIVWGTSAQVVEQGGDLGRMDKRGYVKITGRVKEMIIRGGENLFPAEIENAMLEHDAIDEVAVVGVPDEKWGEQVACFIRSGSDHAFSPSELKTFVRERLSPQKTPAYWIQVADWPLTGSGKIRKFKLAEEFEAGQHTPMR